MYWTKSLCHEVYYFISFNRWVDKLIAMGFTLKINTDSAVYYWTVMCVLQGDIKSHGTMCPKDTQALSVLHPGFSSLAHISGGILSGV